MLTSDQASAIGGAPWFQTHSAPYLLVDSDLRIRAVNKAYESVTAQPRHHLLGQLLFDAFPDNPADPHADGVATLSNSLELVFRRGARHCIGVQRYDVPDRQRPGEFIYKVWTPVNSPIRSQGRTIAVLHHPLEVTGAASAPVAGGTPPLAELRPAADALGRQFPAIPAAEVLGVLTHSQCVVMSTLGRPDIEQAITLATLRLEIRIGLPALATTDLSPAGRPNQLLPNGVAIRVDPHRTTDDAARLRAPLRPLRADGGRCLR